MRKRIFKKHEWPDLKLAIMCSYNIHYGDFPSLKSIFRYYYKHPEKGIYIPWILEGAGFKYMNYEFYESEGKYRVTDGGEPVLIESYKD